MEYLWTKIPIDKALDIEPIAFTPDELSDKLNSLAHEIRTYGIRIV